MFVCVAHDAASCTAVHNSALHQQRCLPRRNIQTDVSRRGELYLPRIILHGRYFRKLSSQYAVSLPPLPPLGETIRFGLHERVIILSIKHRPRLWSDRKCFMDRMMYFSLMMWLVTLLFFNNCFFLDGTKIEMTNFNVMIKWYRT